jgi:hypothetical protein
MSSLPPQTPAHNMASTSSNPVMPEAPRPQRIADFQGRANDAVPVTPGPSGSAATAASAQSNQPFSQEQISALARMLKQSVQSAGGAEQVHEGRYQSYGTLSGPMLIAFLLILFRRTFDRYSHSSKPHSYSHFLTNLHPFVDPASPLRPSSILSSYSIRNPIHHLFCAVDRGCCWVGRRPSNRCPHRYYGQSRNERAGRSRGGRILGRSHQKGQRG